MDNSIEKRLGRFDQVRILTTRNVNYVSAPPGTIISPKGIWSIAAVLNDRDLLCVRNNVTVRIPVSDVLKVADFDVASITKNFGRLANGKETKS